MWLVYIIFVDAELGELTCVNRAEVLKRVHRRLLSVIELLGLRAAAKHPYIALVASEADLGVLRTLSALSFVSIN
jgi:hypothetical protein